MPLLVLCHVVGTFCPLEAPATSQAEWHPPPAPAGHAMSEGTQCQDSVTSFKPLWLGIIQAVAVSAMPASIPDRVGVFARKATESPHKPDLPLFTLLSTLRI